VIREGEMPSIYFVALHPAANLSSQDKTLLIEGLDATAGITGGGEGEEEDD